ncbi:unnamed protein product [Clonostachys byssicola]|uniref:CHAT domain-containing protein n=1 Tax=Clonostachys byssicola TaxID=160290 RepID=A0A9N9Y307_9HYPO|nr:unnamed protein product [Clonostachys byssicola]
MSNSPEAPDSLESDWSSFRRIIEEQVGVIPNEEDVTKSRNAELDSAISQARELVDATPDGHIDKPERVYSLGKQHQNRYVSFLPSRSYLSGHLSHDYQKRKVAEISEAVRLFEEALARQPERHPQRSDWLHSLGAGLQSFYFETGEIDRLETAIVRLEEAVNATPQCDSFLADRLHSLGSAYRSKYGFTGMIEDLELAFQHHQRAVDTTRSDDAEWTNRVFNLGDLHFTRYKRLNAIADLEAAFEKFQEVTGATQNGDLEYATRLQALATVLYERYLRLKAIKDLDMSISLFGDALNESRTPLLRAHMLHSIGLAYQAKFRKERAPTWINIAIAYHQRALDAMPSDHKGRGELLHSLGESHYLKYDAGASKGTTDIDSACQRFQEALDETPNDVPERTRRLHSLCTATIYQALEAGRAPSTVQILKHLHEAFANTSSPTSSRIRVGKQLYALHVECQEWSLAAEVAQMTISLIPRLAPRSLENSDKQNILAEVADIASDAAALALKTGKPPYEAIRLLELGRGVLGGSLRELRTDISKLQVKNPQLAEEYCRNRDQLEAATSSADRFNQRYEAGQNIERTIRAIRQLPPFSRFMMGPSEDEMKVLAAMGPIVIINVSYYGCHALTVEKSGIKALKLPGLRRDGLRFRGVSLNLLGWLWDAIADPILNALGFTETPKDQWPRMWWVPTGRLAKFPLHAAGHHVDGSSRVAMNRVISSYSSSIQALIQNYENHSSARHLREKILLVGMEKTPGQINLPFVPQEIDKVRSICGSMEVHVAGGDSSLESILSSLKDCDIFHFAGHGHTNPSDPSDSSLLLGDGAKKLTVSSLLKMNLWTRMPFLAYLSACGTGRMNHDELIDEALHLISAFQLAGFRHAIGTMWEVNDELCVEVAGATYQWMKSHGMSDASVSEGLHRTIRELRAKWVTEKEFRAAKRMSENLKRCSIDNHQTGSSEGLARDMIFIPDEELPLSWVPYVHFGF